MRALEAAQEAWAEQLDAVVQAPLTAFAQLEDVVQDMRAARANEAGPSGAAGAASGSAVPGNVGASEGGCVSFDAGLQMLCDACDL